MANHRHPPRPGGSSPPRRDSKPGGPARRPFKPTGPVRARSQNAQPDRRGKDQDAPSDADRLQKVLAHAGLGSRRACEEMITQGRVTINGQVVRELGTKVDPRSAKIALDGQKVQLERQVYFAVHKPKGHVSTNHDPSGKPRVIDLLPEIPQRVYCVGRLDEQSTGLLLLTNDGDLANKLAHPKFGVEKVYRVVVAGSPPREVLQQLTDGIWLAEGKVRAKRVRIVGSRGQASVMEMVLAEGKNREIRRMLAKLGHKVMSLTRIAVGPVGLKGLGVGECRALTGKEIELLQKVAAGIPVPTLRAPDRRDRTPRPPRKGSAPPPSPQAAGTARDERQDRRPPRPEGRRSDGPPRPPGRRVEGGPPPGRPALPPSRRPANGPPRSQSQGPRPGGPGRPRPQGRPSGPAPGPGRPSGPPPSARPRANRDHGPSQEPPSTRRIIGMEPQPGRPGEGRGGPPGPRGRKPPSPRKFPRASLGLKRKPKPGEGEG